MEFYSYTMMWRCQNNKVKKFVNKFKKSHLNILMVLNFDTKNYCLNQHTRMSVNILFLLLLDHNNQCFICLCIPNLKKYKYLKRSVYGKLKFHYQYNLEKIKICTIVSANLYTINLIVICNKNSFDLYNFCLERLRM
jgi:hypothetical protein